MDDFTIGLFILIGGILALSIIVVIIGEVYNYFDCNKNDYEVREYDDNIFDV